MPHDSWLHLSMLLLNLGVHIHSCADGGEPFPPCAEAESEEKVFGFIRQSLLISLEATEYLFRGLILLSNGSCVAYYAEALLGKYGECNVCRMACEMSEGVELNGLIPRRAASVGVTSSLPVGW